MLKGDTIVRIDWHFITEAQSVGALLGRKPCEQSHVKPLLETSKTLLIKMLSKIFSKIYN